MKTCNQQNRLKANKEQELNSRSAEIYVYNFVNIISIIKIASEQNR